jgi:hypothetical protein
MPDGLARSRQDLGQTPSVVWLWCAPAVIAIGASFLVNNHTVALTAAGVLWTIATAWIGIGCIINARRCGRVHCAIDAVLFPLLSLSGLLNIVGVLAFSWNLYWAIFFVILGASFVPELFGTKYVGGARGAEEQAR